jgi:hypothetical protein
VSSDPIWLASPTHPEWCTPVFEKQQRDKATEKQEYPGDSLLTQHRQRTADKQARGEQPSEQMRWVPQEERPGIHRSSLAQFHLVLESVYADRSILTGVSEDIPADVSAVLSQLFEEAREALAEGETGTCRQAIESAEEVATNKLPESEFREQVLYGCERVRRLLDGEDEEDVEAAQEFLSAMHRRIPDQES